MAPYDPLAMQRYRARQKTLAEEVAAGAVQPWQAKAELTALAERLLKKRAEPTKIEPPTKDGSSSD